MSRLLSACVLGASLAVIGCSAGTPELGPAKEVPKVDQDQIKKGMEESMRINNSNPNAPSQIESIGGGEKKAE